MVRKNVFVVSLLAYSFIPLFATKAVAQPIRSDLRKENVFERNELWRPERLMQMLTDQNRLGGFDELVPFVLASPDQDEAGSCLYMATTGIAEWWLARLNPKVSRSPDGPIDLSERYLMNVAGVDENETHLPDWRTDSIYLFNNAASKSVLNSSYRFTKGWYKGTSYGNNLEPAKPHENGAEYGTNYNWISELQTIKGGEVVLPHFKREVVFADPEHNQWNIGVAPENIVDTVKKKLATSKAPVLVIYNHNSYWHTVYLIGYNDEIDNGNCSYTQRFRQNISTRIAELEQAARDAKTDAEREAYLVRAKRSHEAQQKIENTYTRHGGCTSSKGVFYIRDSIYPDEKGPIYDYDPANNGEESPYSKKIVFKEYDWLYYFANHIVVVTAE